MDIRSLRLFLTVYDCRNISVAADRLGMNQPAISKAIQRLEHELGVSLFEREPRGVSPTLFGDMLSEAAREIDSNLNATLRRIDAVRNATEGEIAVGAGGTWQETILPVAVARLAERRPRARFRILPAAPEELIASLIAGKFDLVLAPIDIPEATAGKVRAEPLLVNKLTVIGRGDHPLLANASLTMDQLRQQRWVLPPGSLVRDRFERAFRSQGMEPPLPAIECVDSACLFQIVEATDVLTYLSDFRLRPRRHMNLARFPDNPLNAERTSGLILRKSSYLPPLAQELIEEVRALSRAEAATT